MENNEENHLVLFPAYEALKQETERLRTELSMLYLERDELCYVECKNLEMQYMLELGALEYKTYQAQCAALRSKRKLELIRTQRNRQEPIFLPQIEALLDEEFAEYQQKLEEQLDKVNAALHRSQGKVLSAEEEKELKSLYRQIVKALHPDLHPEHTDGQNTLFLNAVKAYENGDLNTLRIISEMLSEPPEEKVCDNALETLEQEKVRLTSLLEHVRESIRQIRSHFPYTIKSLLNDPEKVCEKKRELEALLAQYQTQNDYYLSEIQALLR